MNKNIFIGLWIIFLLVTSIIPVTAVSTDDVNEYSSEVANFVKEKCHGSCEDVIILGDDYVVPSFRRNVNHLIEFLWFDIGERIDHILTDIGYIQKKSKTFAEFDDLFKIKHDDTDYEGKNVLIIRPDNPSTAQNNEIDYFKQVLRNRSYNPDFEEMRSSDVYCNDPHFFSDFNGRTIFVFGTEENNNAYNCFPFQAGLANRDAAFIDINPWDGENYAVIVNTNDPNVIRAFANIIYKKQNQNLRSEGAYFFDVGTETAGYVAIGVCLIAMTAGTGGAGAPVALILLSQVTEGMSDWGEVANDCKINPDGYGWCAASTAFAIIPFVPGGPIKRFMKGAVDPVKFNILKPVKNLITKYFNKLKNIFGEKIWREGIENANDNVHAAKGFDMWFKGATDESVIRKRLNKIPLDDANKLDFLKKVGEAEDSFVFKRYNVEGYGEIEMYKVKEVKFVPRTNPDIAGADGVAIMNPEGTVIMIADDLGADPDYIKNVVLLHEYGHASLRNELAGVLSNIQNNADNILNKIPKNKLSSSLGSTEEFMADMIAIKNNVGFDMSKQLKREVRNEAGVILNRLNGKGNWNEIITLRAQAKYYADQTGDKSKLKIVNDAIDSFFKNPVDNPKLGNAIKDFADKLVKEKEIILEGTDEVRTKVIKDLMIENYYLNEDIIP